MRMIQEAVSRRAMGDKIRVELWLLKEDIGPATGQLKQGNLGQMLVVEPKGRIDPP
jgi:hypothetical protein